MTSNVLVVAQVVVGFVIVDVVLGEAVLPGDLAAFVPVAADERGETRFFAGDERRQNLVEREVPRPTTAKPTRSPGGSGSGTGPALLFGLGVEISGSLMGLASSFRLGGDGGWQEFAGQRGGDQSRVRPGQERRGG